MTSWIHCDEVSFRLDIQHICPIVCVCFFSKIQPGPVWTWVLSYASSVLGSTETWGLTCRVFAPWTSMICHENSRWFSVPSATTWLTVYGRLAPWATVNQCRMLPGKDSILHVDIIYSVYLQIMCLCLQDPVERYTSSPCVYLSLQRGTGVMDQGQIWAESVCVAVSSADAERGPRYHSIWSSLVGSDGAQPP